MVKGLDKFKDYFRGYEEQYILIGDAACDVAMNWGRMRKLSHAFKNIG